jgi:hypothetical protein
MCNSLIAFFLYLTSCGIQDSWTGGRVTDVGDYNTGTLRVVVTEDNNSINYSMFDSDGNILVKSDRNFSSFQKWALHLDNAANLWVFSSDIGHSCWARDTVKKRYIKREFVGSMPIDSMQRDVYTTLKLFHPFSRK